MGHATKAQRSLEQNLAIGLAKEITAHRMGVADKIVSAIVDRICTDIIRPGPKPEERECYVVAQELRDHSPHLRELVCEILRIEKEEP